MITLLGVALGAFFILVPLLAAYFYRIGIAGKMLFALLKMLLRIGLIGVVLHFLILYHSVLWSIVFAVMIVGYSVLSVLLKSRLQLSVFVMPVLSGVMCSMAVVGSILLFANLSVGDDFCVRYLVPVLALLAGGIIDPMSRSLTVYYMGLRHHNHLYYYLIGNGFSRSEALRYLQKRAIEQSLMPFVKKMSTLAAGVSPVLMWTMVMCGRSAEEAVGWQVLIILAVLSATVLSVCVALEVARRYVLDGYAVINISDKKNPSAKTGEKPYLDRADGVGGTAPTSSDEPSAYSAISEESADAGYSSSNTQMENSVEDAGPKTDSIYFGEDTNKTNE